LSVAVDLAIIPSLTAVDKSQVFALNLKLRKFVKKPTDWIRCKFSIDEIFAVVWVALPVHHFETITTCAMET
jgi:hypothetical protein